MRYHPDRNAEPRAAEAFILVNEAYEYLSDPQRRTVSAPMTGRARDEARRKARHDDWEAYQREAARRRAEAYARASVDEFERSPLFKAAMFMDRIYNYLFIILGMLIIILPFIGVYTMDEEYKEDYNYFILIVPVILGLVFVYGMWYFTFKLEED